MEKETNKQRQQRRNKAVRDYYAEFCRKNPQWRHAAVVEVVAYKFFLSESTINCILAQVGNYKLEL